MVFRTLGDSSFPASCTQLQGCECQYITCFLVVCLYNHTGEGVTPATYDKPRPGTGRPLSSLHMVFLRHRSDDRLRTSSSLMDCTTLPWDMLCPGAGEPLPVLHMADLVGRALSGRR